MLDLRCPVCQRWLLEIRQGDPLQLRVRCTSCKRMWLYQLEGGQLAVHEKPRGVHPDAASPNGANAEEDETTAA